MESKVEYEIVYIHGLGSSSKGDTATYLKENFSNVRFFEWNQETCIDKELDKLSTELVNINKAVMIVGSSTGGNFAITLRDYMLSKNKYADLVLINPLISLSVLVPETESLFTDKFSQYIKAYSFVENSCILLSTKDDIIDYGANVDILFENSYIEFIKDTHSANSASSLETLKRIMIDEMNSIHI